VGAVRFDFSFLFLNGNRHRFWKSHFFSRGFWQKKIKKFFGPFQNSRDADDATECGNAASAGKRRKRPADDLTDDDDEAVDAENEVLGEPLFFLFFPKNSLSRFHHLKTDRSQ